MKLEEIFDDKNFLKLLDREDSEDMAEYLYNHLNISEYRLIADMFNSLGIFQDIAVYNADPNRKYKYIIHRSFNDRTRGIVDVRGSKIYFNGIYNPIDCEIIFDNTTIIQRKGLRIVSRSNTDKYILTFLGIPKFEDYGGIEITIDTVSQIEIRAKADIVDKIKELFEERYIKSNRVTLKNRIEEI